MHQIEREKKSSFPRLRSGSFLLFDFALRHASLTGEALGASPLPPAPFTPRSRSHHPRNSLSSPSNFSYYLLISNPSRDPSVRSVCSPVLANLFSLTPALFMLCALTDLKRASPVVPELTTGGLLLNTTRRAPPHAVGSSVTSVTSIEDDPRIVGGKSKTLRSHSIESPANRAEFFREIKGSREAQCRL